MYRFYGMVPSLQLFSNRRKECVFCACYIYIQGFTACMDPQSFTEVFHPGLSIFLWIAISNSCLEQENFQNPKKGGLSRRFHKDSGENASIMRLLLYPATAVENQQLYSI